MKPFLESTREQIRERYLLIAPEILDALCDFGELRRPVGGFLTKCLENDFVGAVCRADAKNIFAIVEIAKLIYNELPSTCWGSPQKVRAWLDAADAVPTVIAEGHVEVAPETEARYGSAVLDALRKGPAIDLKSLRDCQQRFPGNFSEGGRISPDPSGAGAPTEGG